ncbi:TRAP transporter large permease [Roseiarcaceae bacterium H3SJ34-1]|uniref:TRAP transporter large permease n=1 Tax=Terripilifer ovatus TaxID=3032367 RepID=UPI003AB98FE9|nr:TRAP transporter large permease [Roseiarcaceae bacterium H3SJ34-1]
MSAFAGFGIFLVVLLGLFVLRTPVGVALGMVAVAGVAAFVSPGALSQLASLSFSISSSFIIVVVPLFIFMGEILAATRIGGDLFRATELWMRRIPGALAVGTIWACAIFGSVCGSSPVTATTIGSMAIPQMLKRGYDKSLALGATAAGGTLGILIPPSIPMIVYGVITDTSIGHLFIAGIFPGILLATLLSATAVFTAVRRPEMAPPITERPTWPQRWKALGAIIPVLCLSFMVIGAIYTGLATPTEAGAIGAAGALLIAWVTSQLSRAIIMRSLDRTIRTTAMFLLLLTGGFFSSFMLSRLGIPQATSDALLSLPVPPWAIMVIINLVLLVLGMFMDPGSIIVIVIPIFLKAVQNLGYDPVWFGIIVTIQSEIAAITPPVGFNLFVLKSVTPGANMRIIARGSIIFVVPMLVCIAILTAFPDIVMFLPRLLLGIK